MLRQSFVFLAAVACVISGTTPNTESTQVCDDEECGRVGKLILDGMDESVDPCNDFFQYVCGKRNFVDTHIEIKEPKDLGPSKFAIAFTDILKEDRKPEDSKALALEKQIFRTCLNLGTGKSTLQDKLYLISLLKSTDGLGAFSPSSKPRFSKSWQEADNSYAKLSFGNAFFKINQLADLNKSGKNIILIQPPVQHYSIQEGIKNRLDDIRFIKSENFTRDISEVVKQELKLKDVNFAKDESYIKVLEFVNALEELLIKTWNASETRDRMNIRDWQRKYDSFGGKQNITQINWLETLNNLFSNVNITISDSEEILVQNQIFFDDLIDLLQRTDPDTITLYVHLKFISKAAKYTDISLASSNNESREMYCMSGIKRIGVAYEFVKRNYLKERRDIAIGINLQLLNYLENRLFQAWKNGKVEETRKRVKARKIIIGYENWVENFTYVSNYFGDLKPSHILLENMVNLKKIRNRKLLLHLREPEKYHFKSPYFNELHSISTTQAEAVVSAEYFDAKLYSLLGPKLPLAINYGAYGSEMGQIWSAYLHALDGDSKKPTIDPTQKSCIENYLVSTKLPDVKAQDISTVAENTMYFLNGLRSTFIIFNETKNGKGTKNLKGLEKLSPDQLYFVGYAINSCAYYPGDSGSKRLQVNQVVGNMDEFSTAFQCPTNTPMNRNNKCTANYT